MIKAVVLDMDGIMFDTEKLFVENAIKAAKDCGYEVPIETFVSIIGKRKDLADETLKNKIGHELDIEKFRIICDKYMNQDIKENGLSVKKGLFELIDYLKSNNIKIGIASASTKEEVEERFKQANLDKEKIDTIICGYMIENPKPNPEIYIKSCELLEENPKDVLAIEDSDYGIIAATRAGLRAILITDIKEPTKEALQMAYKEVNSLLDVIDLIKKFMTI